MPSSEGQRGRSFHDHRQVVEGIVYRLRTGVAWRDLPESFGPHQTVSKRHRRFSHSSVLSCPAALLACGSVGTGESLDTRRGYRSAM